MQDIEAMVKTALGNIESMLDTKSVVGDPVTIGEYTILPLISMGFGFGTGTGTGKSEEIIKGEGAGAGVGGGGGVKPVAVVIVGPDGVRVEPLKGATASLLESLASRVKSRLKNDDR